MSEARAAYIVASRDPPDPPLADRAILTADTDLYALRAELEEIERRLIPLLVTVQRALGKEPSLITRANARSK